MKLLTLDLLKVAMKRHGKTQTEIACALGVDPAHISRIMKGRDDPSQRLLDALGYKRVTLYERVKP